MRSSTVPARVSQSRSRKPCVAAVALVDALAGTFAVRGTEQHIGLERDPQLRGEANHLSQQTGIGGLLLKSLKRNLVVGHRGVLGSELRVATQFYPGASR